jgi:hypothetical protein
VKQNIPDRELLASTAAVKKTRHPTKVPTGALTIPREAQTDETSLNMQEREAATSGTGARITAARHAGHHCSDLIGFAFTRQAKYDDTRRSEAKAGTQHAEAHAKRLDRANAWADDRSPKGMLLSSAVSLPHGITQQCTQSGFVEPATGAALRRYMPMHGEEAAKQNGVDA